MYVSEYVQVVHYSVRDMFLPRELWFLIFFLGTEIVMDVYVYNCIYHKQVFM